jgi:uncharacterized repeat protein (TIGR03803 family)
MSRSNDFSMGTPEVVRPITTHPIILVAAFTVVLSADAATHYEQLKAFGFPPQGQQPSAPLIQGSDGALYGTTWAGGTDNAGVVFKMNQDGSGYRVLHDFRANGVDGLGPASPLLEGTDGVLYGTTYTGGTNNAGTVFRLNRDGSGYRLLHTFSTNAVDGTFPWRGGVIEGSDGALYGTTSGGGKSGAGTVFTLKKDGTAYSLLYAFSTTDDYGYFPASGLVQGSDGALYGTTGRGGTNDAGTIFKIDKDGGGYTPLYYFTGVGRGWPPMWFTSNPLIEGSDGSLYGTASRGGGTNNAGTLFKINKDGSGFRVLHSFGNDDGDGADPAGGLLQASDGFLYGVTSLGGGTNNAGTVFKLKSDGSSYTLLHTFTADATGGLSPQMGLLEARDGTLYGATAGGGAGFQGTVFRLEKDGSGYRVLRNFWDADSTGGDGGLPVGLISGSDGALYGMTQSGGLNDAGTVFKLSRDGGGYTVLLTFGSTPVDGVFPQAKLLEGSDGTLYGTTLGGTYGAGTVFKLSKDGTVLTILHSFTGVGGDGNSPFTALMESRDGTLYGTTGWGGVYTNQNPRGSGTIFRLNKDGSGYSILHSFAGTGGNPRWPSALLEGGDGALYGTTAVGGDSQYYGTVFKLNKDGSGFRLLHSFGFVPGDGANPSSGLLEGSDGALYGTTSTGTSNEGVVFRMNHDGSGYTILHTFDRAGVSGQDPIGGLVEGSDGALYGTTAYGGASTNLVWGVGWFGAGTVFRLNKDGSGFRVLYSFSNDGSEGEIPQTALVQGSDGAFYGTTSHGGFTNILYGSGNPPPPAGAGSVFKMFPPETLDLIGIARVNGRAQVSFAGLGGSRYDILRSTNLANWLVLTNIVMPPKGIYTHADGASLIPAAYYRAAWAP